MVHVAPVVRLSVRLSSIALLFYALSLLPVASAASYSPWANADPSISYEELLTPTEFSELRSHRMGYKTRDECVTRNVRTQGVGVFFRKYKLTCWYNTAIGLLSQDGTYLLRKGTDVAAAITTGTHSSQQTNLNPTPNPDIFIETVPLSGGNGHRIQFHHVEDLTFQEEKQLLGGVRLYYDSSPRLALRTEEGNHMVVGHTSSWWSSDGETMLVWHNRNGTLYRISMNDFSVHRVVVRSSNAVIQGSAALSPSGRYAAVALKTGQNDNFVLIDYESCTNDSGQYVKTGTNCVIANFSNLLSEQIPEYGFSELPRFYGEHTLGFYHRPYNSRGDYTQYILQANGTTRTTNNYVALGDSYSSGEGAGSYLPGTDNFKEPGRNMCHTSTNSYPFLINRQLELDSFLSVACSGARIVNYSKVQYEARPLVSIQYYHPGNKTQQLPLAETNPNIVTLTLSGNDIGFKDKLIKCILTDTCYSTYESRMEIVLEIQKERPLLVIMYRDMLKKMGPNARLYVLGYPQVVATHEGTSCGVNVRLSASERQMTFGLIEYFNAVIRSAANEAGARYVDIEDSLVGHRLCEAPSAAVAVNGLSFGSDGNLVPVGNASFHPNELGHELIKNTVLERTNNFTTPMPNPTSRTIPIPEDFTFLNAPKSILPVRTLYNNSRHELPLLIRGKNHTLNVDSPITPLRPDTSYDVVIRSNPMHLGTITTNGAGFINAEVTIPEDAEPGLHSIHIQGLSQDNQPIDVYEFVYVAAHEDDFDGDGIPNNQEACGGLIQESGTDYDADGIDDACDPYIGDKPVDTVESDSTEPASIPTPSQTSYSELPALRQDPQAPADNQAVAVEGSDEPNNPENLTMQNVLSSVEDGSVSTATGTQNDPPPSNSNHLLLLVLGITLVLLLGYSIFYHAKQKK